MDKIITNRLILRPWQQSDSKDLYEYAKTEVVGPNAGWKPHKSEEESKEIINMFNKNGDTLAIVLKEENKVIGSIGIHNLKPDEKLEHLKQRELGYVLNPKYWGNGYVPEATNKVIEYCFKNLDLDLVWVAHYDFNNRSKRVAEKCGFNYRFTKNEILERLDNKQVTVLYYNITKEEYVKSLIK